LVCLFVVVFEAVVALFVVLLVIPVSLLLFVQLVCEKVGMMLVFAVILRVEGLTWYQILKVSEGHWIGEE
jgi:hypothetical protein